MGTVHVYYTGNGQQEWEADRVPNREDLKRLVGGDIEYVSVLYKGKPTKMVVNESGAVQDPPLPVNEKATEIYHAASLARKERGEDIRVLGPQRTWPKIHGVAVVLEDIHVE